MSYQRHNLNISPAPCDNLHLAFKPIYDDTFAELLKKLDLIEFRPPKKS